MSNQTPPERTTPVTKTEFDEVRHFFFSGLEEQTYQGIELIHGDENHYGKFISLGFMMNGERIIQRYTFKNFSDDSILTPEEEIKFCSMLGINLKEERERCKEMLVRAIISSKQIITKRIFKDGSTKTETL